jgi:arylsulfatase A-like enzyme
MRLREDVVTIAQRLRDAGFRTTAVVSSRLVLHPDLGLGRGFETYDVVEPRTLPASGEGASTADRAIARLRERGGPKSFLWVHFFDAHLPYLPPPPWDRVYGDSSRAASPRAGVRTDSLDTQRVAALRARYAGEVSFVDRCVGRIAAAMQDRGKPVASLLVITADHGEGLGDHGGYFGHDLQVYDTSLRVPLIVVPLGQETVKRGLVSSEPARTYDGRDLLHDAPPTGAATQLFAETHPEPGKGPTLFAIRTAEAKVIWCPEERRWEYYDLRSDPAETTALARADSACSVIAAALVADLRKRPVGTGRTIDEERGGPDEETRRALQTLGYVGGN